MVTPRTIYPFDDTIPDNLNGGFATVRSGGLELGLPAQVTSAQRLLPNVPNNVQNVWDYGRTYTFYTSSFHDAGWTVNTDYDNINPTGRKIEEYDYALIVDGEPAPIEILLGPASIYFGNTATPTSGGMSTTFLQRDTNNVMVQSIYQTFKPPPGICTITFCKPSLAATWSSRSPSTLSSCQNSSLPMLSYLVFRPTRTSTAQNNGVEVMALRVNFRDPNGNQVIATFFFNKDGNTYDLPQVAGGDNWSIEWSINTNLDPTDSSKGGTLLAD